MRRLFRRATGSSTSSVGSFGSGQSADGIASAPGTPAAGPPLPGTPPASAAAAADAAIATVGSAASLGSELPSPVRPVAASAPPSAPGTPRPAGGGSPALGANHGNGWSEDDDDLLAGIQRDGAVPLAELALLAAAGIVRVLSAGVSGFELWREPKIHAVRRAGCGQRRESDPLTLRHPCLVLSPAA